MMDDQLKNLINESIILEAEYYELLSIKIGMLPRWALMQLFKGDSWPTEKEQEEAKEKFKKLGARKR
jgi:hypothetical protein